MQKWNPRKCVYVPEKFADKWEKIVKFAKANKMSVAELLIRAALKYMNEHAKLEKEVQVQHVHFTFMHQFPLSSDLAELLFKYTIAELDNIYMCLLNAKKCYHNVQYKRMHEWLTRALQLTRNLQLTLKEKAKQMTGVVEI